MKTLSLVIALALTMTACSSGSTVADAPPANITGLYSGNYISSNERDEGNMTLNIAEDQNDNLSGTFQVAFNREDESCLENGTIASGSVDGFSISISVTQDGGSLVFQLTNNGMGQLAGTYVSSGSGCSNPSGSGDVTFTRS